MKEQSLECQTGASFKKHALRSAPHLSWDTDINKVLVPPKIIVFTPLTSLTPYRDAKRSASSKLHQRSHPTLVMKSLLIPSNDAIQRLEQAFQLFFESSQARYTQLCKAFFPLGGLPRAWLIKGDSGAGNDLWSYTSVSLLCFAG